MPKTKPPDYAATMTVIGNLKMDDHDMPEADATRSQQFQALCAATPHLAPTDQALLFERIWNSARVVGYFQARQTSKDESEKMLEALFAANPSKFPACSDPACPSCRTVDKPKHPIGQN